jgi:hypothetical protein
VALLQRQINPDYKTDSSFHYLLDQLSSVTVADTGSNRSSVLYYTFFLANGKKITIYLLTIYKATMYPTITGIPSAPEGMTFYCTDFKSL